MGQRVEFPSNSHTCQGYFAAPESGKGPAVIVIQEWWGLVPHVEDLVDRFAGAGVCAIAPDLFHGRTTKSPDEAGRLLMELDAERAEREIASAGDYLLSRTDCSSKNYGVVGFCMGGGLALVLATQRPDAVKAVVPAYGLIPWPDARPDYSKLDAAVLIHAAGQDESFSPADARELETELNALGKEVEVHVYPDANHAVFNEDRPEVYHRESAELLWDRTVAFFRQKLS